MLLCKWIRADDEFGAETSRVPELNNMSKSEMYYILAAFVSHNDNNTRTASLITENYFWFVSAN